MWGPAPGPLVLSERAAAEGGSAGTSGCRAGADGTAPGPPPAELSVSRELRGGQGRACETAPARAPGRLRPPPAAQGRRQEAPAAVTGWPNPPASSAPSSPASPQARAGPQPSREATKGASSPLGLPREGRPRVRLPAQLPPEPLRGPAAPGDRKRPSRSRFMAAAPALRPARLRSDPPGCTRARSATPPRGSSSGPELWAAQPDCARSLPPDPPLGSTRLPGSGTGGAARGEACQEPRRRARGRAGAEGLSQARSEAPPLPPRTPAGGAGGAAGNAPETIPCVPAVRGSGGPRSLAFFVPVFRPSPRPWAASTASPPGAMAAAAGDGAVKPLQCAMKLANGAIELDTGNRPRVRRGAARRARPPSEAGSVGVGEGGAAGWALAGTPGGCGARGAGPASDLGQLPGLSALFSRVFNGSAWE